MTHTVISVTNLGKEYSIGARENGYETFREMMVSAAAIPFRRLKRLGGHAAPQERIWALKDVSFDVKEGEVVGIIGRNGAGKSTLLKILSRITAPTTGRAEMRGRVSSLLEVGTGFHPELTGRENIYLNGAILGMSRAEIERKFDEIVDFAGVETFLDTPNKRYSSGMQVRLAFAVAAHLEPEILIVDEVLAVGDAEFQKKCLGKMGEVARSGRTVLFVSHNMGAIRQLCSRAIIIRAGSTYYDGDVERAVSIRLSDAVGNLGSQTEQTWTDDEAPGDGALRLRGVRVRGERSPSPPFRPDEAITVSIEYDQKMRMPEVRFVLYMLTAGGEIAFATTDHGVRGPSHTVPGRYRTRCVIPANLLNRTTYVLQLNVSIPRQQWILKQFDLGNFAVDGVGNERTQVSETRWPGVLCPRIDWHVQPLDSGNRPPLISRVGSSFASRSGP